MNLPDTDHQTVKHIEPVIEIFESSEGGELQHHLNGEDAAEEEVADLQHLRQQLRLVVMLQREAECVEQDTDLTGT